MCKVNKKNRITATSPRPLASKLPKFIKIRRLICQYWIFWLYLHNIYKPNNHEENFNINFSPVKRLYFTINIFTLDFISIILRITTF